MEFLTGFESFVGVNFWTCLFTLCNLVILTLFMKKLLFKPVKKMIDSRQEEIDTLYADATKSKQEAAALQAQMEQRLAAADAECDGILKTAYRRAQKQEEEILLDAKQKAEQTLLRADREIALEQKRARNELKNEVSGIAVSIASAVLSRDIDASEHTKLIDSFLDEMGERDD